MTHAEQEQADEAALNARLARLRAFAEDIAARLQTLPAPETWLDAARAARAIQAADQTLTGLPETPPPSREAHASPATSPAIAGEDKSTASVSPVHGGGGVCAANDGGGTTPQAAHTLRHHLRACADRLLDAADRIPYPETHLEAARAQRYALTAQALLRQLYTTPRPAPVKRPRDAGDFHIFYHAWDDAGGRDDRLPGDPDFRVDNINCIPLPGEEDRDVWEIIEATDREQERADDAEDCGNWPDGVEFDPGDPFYSCPRLQYWAQSHAFTPSAPP